MATNNNIDWEALRKKILKYGFRPGYNSFSVALNQFEKCSGATVSLATTITGGTAPFTYAWSPATGLSSTTASAPIASHTSTITYTVTVTDANAHVAVQTSTVTVPTSVGVTLTGNNILCLGGTTSISTTVTNGSSPFTYVWTGGQTTSTIYNVVNGVYGVTVSDACSNTTFSTITITQPTQLGVTMSGTNVLCYASSTGVATASAFGGTSPYTYLWSNTSTNGSITGLTAGTYNVTVTDSNGCIVTGTVSITQPNLYTMSVTAISNSPITSGSVVSMTASTNSIGVSPFTYVWYPGSMTGIGATAAPTQSTIYTVVATDYCGKTGSGTVSVVVGSAPQDSYTSVLYDFE